MKIEADIVLKYIDDMMNSIEDQKGYVADGYRLAMKHVKEVICQEIYFEKKRSMLAASSKDYIDSQALLNIIKGGKYNGK